MLTRQFLNCDHVNRPAAKFCGRCGFKFSTWTANHRLGWGIVLVVVLDMVVIGLMSGCNVNLAQGDSAVRTARDKFLEWSRSDDDIDTLFLVARLDRDDGATLLEMQDGALALCLHSGLFTETGTNCLNCSLAVLDDVFAE